MAQTLASSGREAAAPVRVGVIAEPTAAHLSYYFNALAACAGVSEIALADPTGEICADGYLSGVPGRDVREPLPQALRARFPALKCYRDYQEMLAALKPELALVSVEAHHAPGPIEAALRAGCHVVADHPACVRLEDFERMEALASSRGRQLMMAFATRLLPPARKARELVAAGRLGRLYSADLYTIADQTRLKSPAYQRSWYAFRSKEGGGHLIRLGLHYIDVLQYISGERISAVSGFYRNVGGQPIDIEDAAAVTLELAGGAVATLHSGYYIDQGYHTAIALWGSSGWLRFDHVSGTPLQWYSTQPGAPEGIQTFSYPPGAALRLPGSGAGRAGCGPRNVGAAGHRRGRAARPACGIRALPRGGDRQGPEAAVSGGNLFPVAWGVCP